MKNKKDIIHVHQDEAALAKTKALTEDISYCMMTTLTPEGHLISRPMTTVEMDDKGFLWFFASKESDLSVALDFDENVNLAYASPSDSKYLSIAGSAEVIEDPKKIAALWNPAMAAWFPEGVADPLLCLIRVHPITAEYWDSPSSKVVQLFGIAKAILTGNPYETAPDHGKINCH